MRAFITRIRIRESIGVVLLSHDTEDVRSMATHR